MCCESDKTDEEIFESMMLTIECEEIVELDDILLKVDNSESPVYETIKSKLSDAEEFDCMRSAAENISQCDLLTSSADFVNDNLTKHEYVCGFCSKTFVYFLHLEKHIQKSHVDFQPVLCMHCGQSLPSGKDLKLHEAKCGRDLLHLDTSCSDSVTNVSEVTYHFDEASCGKSHLRQFTCSHCDSKYRTLKKLNVHKMKCKLRDAQQPYNECTLCDLQFIGADDLKRHVNAVHHNERSFQCSHCGKTFNQSCHLNQHVKQIHFGERPFICNQCDKTFAQSSHLKLHIRHLHSDERPFACTQCNKTFPMASTLQRHQLVHTGEKPYKCVLCQKMFRQLSTMKRHEMSHYRYHRNAP